MQTIKIYGISGMLFNEPGTVSVFFGKADNSLVSMVGKTHYYIHKRYFLASHACIWIDDKQKSFVYIHDMYIIPPKRFKCHTQRTTLRLP